MLLLGGAEVEPLRATVAELLGHDEVVGHLAGMISGLDVRYPDKSDAPLLGGRAPHWELTTETGPSTTAELLRTGHGVLLDFAAGLPSEAVAGWADRVRGVAAAPPHGPGTGSPSESGGTAVNAVLLRPDGHVAWVDDGTTPLHAALHRWFGAPNP
ncbi:hypothetical protein [Streptomyces sp. NPDC014995]|uniref:aromatic-ring hydroxylase C-terminal domain-containing protein n=1 Tax=Streptomyces sp. NPDC014995 TaxID=3364936 RepID=UPI0036F55EFC